MMTDTEVVVMIATAVTDMAVAKGEMITEEVCHQNAS